MGATAEKSAWVELDAAALRANVAVFRQVLGRAQTSHDRPAQLGLVLKGNAYGHGFADVLPLAHPLADLLYVISPVDGLAVRELEQARGWAERRVVVTGAVGAQEVIELARRGVEVALADGSWPGLLQQLRAAKVARRLRVHVFVDSGLSREGFSLTELPGVIHWLRDFADVVEPVGALSHFSNTEDVTEQSYARQQMTTFEQGLAMLATAFPRTDWVRHLAASAAALVLPDARYDAVRVGISLYGLWASQETKLSARVVLGETLKLEPVMSLRCQSQTVKWLPEGSFVGYGCTYRCDQPTRVAVFPVGYFDGYPRLVSGKAHVLVQGQRCRVLGRVMMNHLVVDVTHVRDTAETLTATLLGREGGESISAELLAEWAQTISYEVVTRMGPHLRRVVRG